jgi:hypothetical protein
MRQLERAKAKLEYKKYVDSWRIESEYLKHLIHKGEAEPGTKLRKKTFREWYHTEWKQMNSFKPAVVEELIQDLEWEEE